MRTTFLLFSATLTASLLPAGCTSAFGLYCDKVCECTDCSRSERRECDSDVDDLSSSASKKGCDDAFNVYMQCLATSLQCADKAPSAPGCKEQEDALYKCAGYIGIGKTDCQAADEIYAEKYAACGVDIGGPGPTQPCGSFQGSVELCQAHCVEAATCEAITGEDGAGAVAINNCKDACP